MPDATQPPAATPTIAPSRRGFLRGVGLLAAGSAVPATVRAAMPLPWPAHRPCPRLAVSDIGLNLRGQPTALAVAAAAGLDGIDLDMGRFDRGPRLTGRLTGPAACREAAALAVSHGVHLAAITLTAFATADFGRDPRVPAAVADWLAALRHTGVSVGALDLGDATLLDDAESRQNVVARLRTLAADAARDGRTIAVHLPGRPAALADLLDAAASPALRADVPAEPGSGALVRRLGVARVGRLRVRPDHTAADLADLATALDAAGWSGWAVLDRVTLADPRPIEACEAAAARVQTAQV